MVESTVTSGPSFTSFSHRLDVSLHRGGVTGVCETVFPVFFNASFLTSMFHLSDVIPYL